MSMDHNQNFVSYFTAIFVLVSWFVFALFFVFRKRDKNATKTKRDPASWFGVTIVGVGYAIVWSFRRPMYSPLFENPTLNIISALFAITISVCSIWCILSALRTLGKQWNVEATLVKEHRLITEGVYSIVRNPIYTGMLGMMLATGIAFCFPLPTIIATLIGWYGTHLRIKREEKLLRNAFGESFLQYCQNVPALLPRVFPRK